LGVAGIGHLGKQKEGNFGGSRGGQGGAAFSRRAQPEPSSQPSPELELLRVKLHVIPALWEHFLHTRCFVLAHFVPLPGLSRACLNPKCLLAHTTVTHNGTKTTEHQKNPTSREDFQALKISNAKTLFNVDSEENQPMKSNLSDSSDSDKDPPANILNKRFENSNDKPKMRK